jgi:hypothetical protein
VTDELSKDRLTQYRLRSGELVTSVSRYDILDAVYGENVPLTLIVGWLGFVGDLFHLLPVSLVASARDFINGGSISLLHLLVTHIFFEDMVTESVVSEQPIIHALREGKLNDPQSEQDREYVLNHLLSLDIFIVSDDDGFVRHRGIAKSDDHHHREKQRPIVNEIVEHYDLSHKKIAIHGHGLVETRPIDVAIVDVAMLGARVAVRLRLGLYLIDGFHRFFVILGAIHQGFLVVIGDLIIVHSFLGFLVVFL